jgi:hypothetical protein
MAFPIAPVAPVIIAVLIILTECFFDVGLSPFHHLRFDLARRFIL